MPNSSSMTQAIIGEVQMPVSRPYATGPLSRMSSSCFRCADVSSNGRPERCPSSKPSTPKACFNARQQVDLRDARREEIVQAQQLLRAGKAIKTGLARYFDKNGQVLGRTLDQVEEFDGYSCIFSTQP